MNAVARSTIPSRLRPAVNFERCAFAHARATFENCSVSHVFKTSWPDDAVSPLVTKAASAPATTTTSGWAAALATQAASDFVQTLSPLSAAAGVFARALGLSLGGVNTIALPRRATPPAAGDVPWIEQGQPIPVGQLSVSGGAILGPTRKLALVVATTNETMRASAAEAVFTSMLRESAAVSLDATFFSDLAATDARPAGILNGIAAQSATSGGGTSALTDDLELLAGAIAATAGDMVIICNPRQAFAIRIRLGSNFTIPVLASRSVPAGTVIALDPLAIAVAFGVEPEFQSSQEAVIHTESSSPAAISSAGSPNTVAAPVRSLWQTDCTALRCLLPAAWVLRSPGAVAWLEDATWG
jgi:hypothetical protein